MWSFKQTHKLIPYHSTPIGYLFWYRFTDEAMEREARSLPEVIREKFNSSLIVEYYYNTLYKNKDIDIDTDNNKDNNKNMDKDKGYKLYAKRRDELFAKAGF